MKRLVPPDGAIIETEVNNRVYRRQKDGTVHVSESDVRLLKKEGFFEPNAGGFANTAGWVCQDCGFHGYFIKCGKCQSDNMKRPK